MFEGLGWEYGNSYSWMNKITRMDPLIITVAANGGIQGKEAHAGLPETPEEIAESACEAYNAGASIVHIHGRSPQNWAECTKDPEVYREINRRVREKCPEIIINNTTGGGPTTTMEDRFRCLDALPEMASLNMGPDMSRFRIGARLSPLPHPHDEQIFDECIPFTYGIIEDLARAMKERGIKPEMEIYHPGEYWPAREIIEKRLAEPPYLFQFVMGYQSSSFPTPENLLNLIRELPKGSVFSTIGIGKFQWIMTTMSILLGGNVRVGLEDNVYLSRGKKLKGNGEAVERIVRIARELNREIATPAQARAMLGVSAKPSSY